ncbi:hypothetical protein HPB50_003263 [Hyalomma asiaticum]|uniref:Uncharacterized protein n=1 Tax=Hyalomma asiaticum TaxID=266040 RepID=A0ACB7S029_HYAAI|nr:hypothetical protein HPB50_003263 [Hyalomma asiaticum]
MDFRRTTSKYTSWKFPKAPVSTVVVGDSQTKYLFQHFDPLLPGTPAFVSHYGAVIADMAFLVDFVPTTASMLILHVGTNDLTNKNARTVFDNYSRMIASIQRERPELQKIYATLVLPRTTNRRRGNKNQGFIRRFNREASFFNRLLRSYCKHSSLVHVLDHALEWLPPARVLAADGVHLSFEGAALVASHVRQLCFDSPSQATPTSWEDCAPARQQMVSSPTETRSMSATGPKQKKPTNKIKNRDGRLLEGHDQSTPRVLHSDAAPAVQLLGRGHRLPQQLQEYRPVTKTSISTAETTASTNSPAIASVRPPTGRRSSQVSKGCRAPAQVPSSTVDTNIPANGSPTSAAGPSSQPRYPLRKKYSDAVNGKSHC